MIATKNLVRQNRRYANLRWGNDLLDPRDKRSVVHALRCHCKALGVSSHNEVEKELTGRETEPWEIIYFKLRNHAFPRLVADD